MDPFNLELADNKILEDSNHEIDLLKKEIRVLKEQIEILEETNKSKDKFFSIIAHDLKSPFTGFLGFSEYMAKYSKELSIEDLEDFSKRMFDSARSIYEFIENLLTWSRIKTGRIEFEPKQVNVTELVKRIVELNSTLIESKQIEFMNDFTDNISVFGDENMIFLILRNLISNSLKFTPRGGVIHTGYAIQKSSVIIFVADSGVGMNAEKIEKLFKIEEQSSSEGTENEPGTGMGLILVKEFVDLNGGTIRLESEPGTGTKFFIELPVQASNRY